MTAPPGWYTIPLVMSRTWPFLAGSALLVWIAAAQEPLVAPYFDAQTLDTLVVQPWLKTVGDLDGDRRVDAVVGGAQSGGL